MDLKTKYQEELSLLKNERINRVIQAAKVEFGIHGITNSKLRKIAKRALVGEASLYRYFDDKTALVKMVALEYWENYVLLFNDYLATHIKESDNGVQKVEVFLNIFHDLYDHHHDFLKFMEDFDNHMISHKHINTQSSVGELVLSVKKMYLDIFDEGLADGSIKQSFIARETYSFVSQVMFSTVQKLSFRAGYLEVDDDLDPKYCISSVIKMFVEHIKA